jgi:hypothetical protein
LYVDRLGKVDGEKLFKEVDKGLKDGMLKCPDSGCDKEYHVTKTSNFSTHIAGAHHSLATRGRYKRPGMSFDKDHHTRAFLHERIGDVLFGRYLDMKELSKALVCTLEHGVQTISNFSSLDYYATHMANDHFSTVNASGIKENMEKMSIWPMIGEYYQNLILWSVIVKKFVLANGDKKLGKQLGIKEALELGISKPLTGKAAAKERATKCLLSYTLSSTSLSSASIPAPSPVSTVSDTSSDDVHPSAPPSSSSASSSVSRTDDADSDVEIVSVETVSVKRKGEAMEKTPPKHGKALPRSAPVSAQYDASLADASSSEADEAKNAAAHEAMKAADTAASREGARAFYSLMATAAEKAVKEASRKDRGKALEAAGRAVALARKADEAAARAREVADAAKKAADAAKE